MTTRIGPKTLKMRRIYLREWRKHRGLTQQRLADLLETTKTSISRFENLKRDPSLGFLNAAAHALNCTVADIVSRPPSQPSADSLLSRLTADRRQEAMSIIEVIAKTGT